MTSPPWPPLPPSGPPSGLNFSRCTEATPSPPDPPATWSVTWSTKLGTATSGSLHFDVLCPHDAAETTLGRSAVADRPNVKNVGRLFGRDRRNDVDDLAATTPSELDSTCRQREERVVAATADVGAGVEVRAALANDDLAGVDELAAEALHAEPLRVGIAAVLGRGCALFVCHVVSPLLLDSGDLHLGVLLAVALTL